MGYEKFPKQVKEGRVAQTKRLLVSLIVPVYNEQDSIAPFTATIAKVMGTSCPEIDYEVLFINDGSSDATEPAVELAQAADPRVRLVNLSRNFGKDAALCAGLEHAHGDAAIPMDVDLQDPPELIPEMVEKWQGGAKVVNARRIDRSHDTWLKRLTANSFYKIFNLLAEQKIPMNVGDYRLLDRQVVDVLRQMGERARFNKALFSWVGFDAQEVTFERPNRRAGETTWTYWKLWNFALDGILSASTMPLRVWSYVGFLLSIASFIYAAFVFFYTVVFGADTPGYASTVILILMFGGLNLFAVGILGEYIGRIYAEVRGRPIYVVRSTSDFEDTAHNG
ncbi:glycosyltransferase involved in cell wall biosynthesis [Litoreibacter meonggei]|uniref:Glycosyltransferase involved in cell wall biosynthesis n=1 Tax=Litoreibacter meonggei TaxID=1049199 RepID=A0A497X1P2_9RHOB|nr:glycosyltransferase family 2 protein [Litoreibacter meonggei]RLJ59186.1 glycosyltransferase involved in cell wall biosynthesis [Litoreibacter meonggei]